MLPEAFVEELKFRNPLEDLAQRYVNLKRSGKNFVGCCPFHSEKTPSFYIYPATGSFYCFGCGAGGDVINFVRRIENFEYMEAINFLAQRVGMQVPEDTQPNERTQMKRRIYEINRETARFYHSCLMSDIGKEARSYFVKRGLTIDTVIKFGLGYSPDQWQALIDHLKKKGFTFEEMEMANVAVKNKKGGYFDRFRNRAMFPIIDIRSNVIGFGGRILTKDKGAKYLNTSDTLVFNKSRNLFALNFAKESKQDKIILAEGYMDVIALHQAGFTNSVATLGTALTTEQARLISAYTDNIIISYDSDGAGKKASMRATGIFSEIGIKTSVINMEGAKDPDEYIKKFGAKKFESIINKSKSVLEFEIDRIYEKYNLQIPEEKMKFLNEFCFLISSVRNPIERDVYIGKISTDTDTTKQAINERVESIIKGKTYKQKRLEKRDTKLYVGSTPNNVRDIERTKNIKYALAEDEIIKMLVLNPDYTNIFDNLISAQDFVTDDNRQIFSVIMSRIKEEKSIDISVLSAEIAENTENSENIILNDKQISILTGLMATASAKNYDTSEAKRQAGILLSKKKEKSAEEIKAMSDDEYMSYINSLKAKK